MRNVSPTTSRSLSRGALWAGLFLLGSWAGCAGGSDQSMPGPGTGGTTGGAGGAAGTGGASGPPPGSPVALHGQLKVVGTQLQDASGRPVQLKGVSSQWLNYESTLFPENKEGIQYARDSWKMSVMRAAMGVDAQGGYLGTSTLAGNRALMQLKVDTIVQNAIDLGIYVIVDWHTNNATTQTNEAIAFFTDIAQRYGGSPNVIYEPYNEPRNVMWPQIKTYHQAVVAAIRQVDPDNLIVLGTPNFSQDVDVAAQDPVAGSNLLYTLHFYACTHKQMFRDKGTTAIQRGIALFVTEFGATPADGGVISRGDPYVCEAEANSWFSWMAQNDVSGTSWKLDTCTDTSCILTPNAFVGGPWTDDVLTNDAGGTPVATGGVQPPSVGGHGLFVVNWIRQ
jgi:endoglucanase